MSSFPKKCLVALSFALAALIPAQPAGAYYFGYSPYGFGRAWMWPFNSALYSLTNPFRSYAAAARYPFIWPGQLGYYHPINYGYRQPIIPPNYMGTIPYQDPEPIDEPRERVRPYRPSPYPVDQVSYAQWSRAAEKHAARQQDQGLIMGALTTDPAHAPPVVKPPVGPFAPVAPPAFAPAVSPALAPASGGNVFNTPLASGFVDRVNGKFNGNIRDALFDPETRSWARAMGLVNSDDIFDTELSNAHIDLAKRILQDPSLDHGRKVDAVRAVIKH